MQIARGQLDMPGGDNAIVGLAAAEAATAIASTYDRSHLVDAKLESALSDAYAARK